MLIVTVILDAPSGVTVAVPVILEPLIGVRLAVHFIGATAAATATAQAVSARRIISCDLQKVSALRISDAVLSTQEPQIRDRCDCYTSAIASSSCDGSPGRGVSM